MPRFHDTDAAQIDVHIADLIIATHEASDPQVSPKVRDALRVLQGQLGMDAIFVSRNMEGTPAGRCGLIEASWCEYIARSRGPRLPFDVGSFVSAPVGLPGGPVYGTLGCVSDDARRAGGRDSHWLTLIAQLLAEALEHPGEPAAPLNARPASCPPHAMAAAPGR
jgi:hypothetical protein